MTREKAIPAALKPAMNDTAGVVMRSSLAGIAATILAAAIASPAGLGGMIGVAEGMDRQNADDSANALHLPAGLPEMSAQDWSSINGTLVQSQSEMDAMRARTDAEIEHMREVAETGRLIPGLDIRG